MQAHPESATQACAQSDAAVVPVPPLRFHEELQPSALHAAVRAPPATCVAASTSSSATPASAFVPIARSRSAPLLHNAAGAFGERGLGGSWGLPMLARGEGRGYCNACFVAVTLHKSYWRCACAAWSFNAHLNTARTRFHYRALLAFLDELYVWGNFNARTSRTIVMYLRVHTPLPTRLSSASSAALLPASARAPPSARDSGSGSNVRGDASAMHVHALLPTGSPAEAARIAASPQQSARSDVADGGVQAGAGGSSSSARGTVEMGIEEYLQNLYHDTSRGRTGAGSNGIVFHPAPATIPRGDAYLLD
ncbi:hypothetical protein EON68_04545 [archaeon]|nr:MAG: hypothetical protein EON68_04545 [archaeon]